MRPGKRNRKEKGIKEEEKKEGARKKSNFRPKKALITSGILIILIISTIIMHFWITAQAEEAEQGQKMGVPIGEKTDWGWSYCLKISPDHIVAEPGTNITFHITWRATHYDCPFYLPYGKSVEGIEQNTDITLKNLNKLNETEWTIVPNMLDTFEKTITVQVQNRDGEVKIVRECPWYFDQKAISRIEVPDEEEEKEGEGEGGDKSLYGYLDKWKKDPLFVFLMVIIVTMIPFLIAKKMVKSINSLRTVTQISFFMGINMGVFGFWAIRTYSLPLGAAIPGASCNYLYYNTGNCIVYQLQHFLSSGLQGSLGFLIMLILVFMIMFIAVGKSWCGWACPLGFVQDIFSGLRKRMKIKRHHMTPFQRELLVITKYSILFFGIVLSIIIGITLMGYYLQIGDLYRPICQVCPAYPLFTLLQTGAGISPIDGAQNIPIWSFLILGIFIVVSLKMRRPFCRICPIGALIGFFYKVSGVSLHKDGQKCTKCGMCYRSCPMDIKEVMEETKKDDITTNDCILCMRCVELCPEEDCLSGKFMGNNIISSSYRKFLLQHPLRIRNVLKKYTSKEKDSTFRKLLRKIYSHE